MAFSTSVNGVNIYNLSSSKTLPSFLTDKKKKALKKNEDYRRRIELLQDFAFPEASQTIQLSNDGRFVVATGTYPPRVRVFDTAELSMKFERYMDSTPVSAALLSDDYSKIAFLQDDRNIEVHAAYGKHYKTRIPLAGRHMVYHQATAELVVAASGSDVYRLNLEEGRFMAPMVTSAPSVNKIAISRVTALIGVACDGGTCEFWDPRSHTVASRLELPAASGGRGGASFDATCLAYEEGGMGLVVGTSDGRALLYDMRHGQPTLARPHPYGVPLVDVRFHRGAVPGSDRLVMSTDSKQCRLWHKDTGKLYTNIEAPAQINSIAVASDDPRVGGVDSGVIMMAGEQERVMSYYLPSIGVAPRWASFLDSVTDELEEGSSSLTADGGASASAAASSSVYEDYKFCTRDELATLGLSHLIGTPLLKAYMHGFFIDHRLYARVKATLDKEKDPAAYDAWRKARVKAEVEAGRASRIDLQDSLPAVNRELAARMREQQTAKEAKRAAGRERVGMAALPSSASSSSAAAGAGGGLVDDRFSALFSNPAFAIDDDEAAVVAARRGVSTGQTGGPGKAGGKGGAGGGKAKRGRRDRDSDAEDDE